MSTCAGHRRFGLWSSAVACVVVVGIVVGGATILGLRWSREALTGQAQRAERTLAEERARQVASALDQAEGRLVALAHQPAVAGTFRDATLDRLRTLLTSAAHMPAVAGYTAYDPGGRRLLVAGNGDTELGTTVRYASDVVAGDGTVVGRLAIAVSVPELVSAWAPDGSVVVAHDDGRIVVGDDEARLGSPALLEAVGRDRGQTLTYDGADGRRVAAVAPVERGDFVVIASQPQAQANAVAHRLTMRMLALALCCLAALGVAALVLARIVQRMRADIEADRAAAQRLAVTDPLTGLANRRGLEEAIAGATGTLTVAAVDVDGLKEINDTLGHAAGDGALREVAIALRRAVRTGDVVARTGGDEFVVVSLAGHAEEDFLDRLRQATGELGLVSASIGVASGQSHLFGDLVETADHRCYADKRFRKNAAV